jgi:hypothetical protein
VSMCLGGLGVVEVFARISPFADVAQLVEQLIRNQ